mmetsp:Transcript_5525/g.6362  ORF Transcript_5525/g.6362 Transcript_5525/m.6362 type:complete len:100 (-) Transcript_5525:1315-1614(-)
MIINCDQGVVIIVVIVVVLFVKKNCLFSRKNKTTKKSHDIVFTMPWHLVTRNPFPRYNQSNDYPFLFLSLVTHRVSQYQRPFSHPDEYYRHQSNILIVD